MLLSLYWLYPNVSYEPCIARGPIRGEVRLGDLKEIVVAELTEAQLQRIYLCGDPGLVRILKRHLFLAGISLRRIHVDLFVGTEHAGGVAG